MKVKKTITKTVEVELREEDQCFDVGDYHVDFYWDAYRNLGAEKEYYMFIIQKFDGDTEIARKSFYVLAFDENTYSGAWEELHKENVLESFVKYEKENSKYELDDKGFKKEVIR